MAQIESNKGKPAKPPKATKPAGMSDSAQVSTLQAEVERLRDELKEIAAFGGQQLVEFDQILNEAAELQKRGSA